MVWLQKTSLLQYFRMLHTVRELVPTANPEFFENHPCNETVQRVSPNFWLHSATDFAISDYG